MQSQRIPLAILVGLGLVGGCNCPTVGACLEVAPPDDPVDEQDLTPCLSPPLPPDVGGPEPDTALGPCLEAPPAPLDVGGANAGPPSDPESEEDPHVGPCLKVAPPHRPDHDVGPCLRVAPKCLSLDRGPEPEPDNVPGSAEGMARRDAVERFAKILPDDVVVRLRRGTGSSES